METLKPRVLPAEAAETQKSTKETTVNFNGLTRKIKRQYFNTKGNRFADRVRKMISQ